MPAADLNSQMLAYYKGQNDSYSRPRALLDGRAFFAEAVSGSVAPAGTFEVYVTTGDKRTLIEFIRTRKPTGDYTFQLFKGATFSASTAVSVTDMNMETENTCLSDVGTITTLTDAGTLKYTITHNEGSNFSLGEAAEANFALLAPNTTYMIRYTNDDSQSTVFVGNYILTEEA